jgi:hypothetical protein
MGIIRHEYGTMIENIDMIFYGEIVGGVALVLVLGYFIPRRFRRQRETHKSSEVMNKINDFYSTQNNAGNN